VPDGFFLDHNALTWSSANGLDGSLPFDLVAGLPLVRNAQAVVVPDGSSPWPAYTVWVWGGASNPPLPAGPSPRSHRRTLSPSPANRAIPATSPSHPLPVTCQQGRPRDLSTTPSPHHLPTGPSPRSHHHTHTTPPPSPPPPAGSSPPGVGEQAYNITAVLGCAPALDGTVANTAAPMPVAGGPLPAVAPNVTGAFFLQRRGGAVLSMRLSVGGFVGSPGVAGAAAGLVGAWCALLGVAAIAAAVQATSWSTGAHARLQAGRYHLGHLGGEPSTSSSSQGGSGAAALATLTPVDVGTARVVSDPQAPVITFTSPRTAWEEPEGLNAEGGVVGLPRFPSSTENPHRVSGARLIGERPSSETGSVASVHRLLRSVPAPVLECDTPPAVFPSLDPPPVVHAVRPGALRFLVHQSVTDPEPAMASGATVDAAPPAAVTSGAALGPAATATAGEGMIAVAAAADGAVARLSSLAVVLLSTLAVASTVLPLLHGASVIITGAAVLGAHCAAPTPTVVPPTPAPWLLVPGHLLGVGAAVLVGLPVAAAALGAWAMRGRSRPPNGVLRTVAPVSWLCAPAWRLTRLLAAVSHAGAEPATRWQRLRLLAPAMVALLSQSRWKATPHLPEEGAAAGPPAAPGRFDLEGWFPVWHSRVIWWLAVKVLGPAVWHGALIAASARLGDLPVALQGLPAATRIGGPGDCVVLSLASIRWVLWLCACVDGVLCVSWALVVAGRVLTRRAAQHRVRHGFAPLLPLSDRSRGE
jgi:hypothetical protein